MLPRPAHPPALLDCPAKDRGGRRAADRSRPDCGPQARERANVTRECLTGFPALMEARGGAGILPQISDRSSYAALRARSEVWEPAVRVVCCRHGLPEDLLEPLLRGGTHVVFAVGCDWIVKLFAPPWVEDFEAERACARAVRNVGVQVPELREEGELEGWPYLVTSRLAGTTLDRVWRRLGPRARLTVADDLGRLASALHAHPTDGLAALPADWDRFVAEQRTGCVARHRERGVGEAWLRGIEPLLETAFEEGRPSPSVLLHADLCEENLLVRQTPGGARLSGVVDFGDARLGDPEYEFAAPAAMLTDGPAELPRVLLRAYGHLQERIDPSLAVRLTAHVLIHRYVDLPELFARLGPPVPASPWELAERLWCRGRA